MIEISLDDLEESNNQQSINQIKEDLECPICSIKASEKNIREKFHRIHTCREAVICQACYQEFNQRQVKKCPICRSELQITMSQRTRLSETGITISLLVLVILSKIVFECILTPIILKANSSKDYSWSDIEIILLIISNGIFNYGGILFLGIICGCFRPESLRVWLYGLSILMLAHIILLVVLARIESENPFKIALLYFNLPLYGLMYFISGLGAIYFLIQNTKSCCMSCCCEKRIYNFRIEPIEVIET